MSHQSVMLQEVLEALNPCDEETYIDATFGAGGYSKAILEKAQCSVIALDRDDSVKEHAQRYKDEYGERFLFAQARFGDLLSVLAEYGIKEVDGLVLDLGVSSMQLDQGERGFSFRYDAPLDMRMGGKEDIPTAYDIVNEYEEEQLANIIYNYGQERYSRRVAKEVVKLREETPIKTTGQLADIIRKVVPKSKRDSSDQATRTFQALRIAVNDELGELEKALENSEHILKPGGRLVVVTFHSLEDALVKKHLQKKSSAAPKASRHMPQVQTEDDFIPVFTLIHKKALKPSQEEIEQNPRARSAKLRAAARTQSMQRPS